MHLKRHVHLILVIVFLLLFICSMRIMRFYANSVENYNKEKILDLRFGYSTTDVNKYLAFLSSEGKQIYLNKFYLIDSFYPIIYTMFYVLTLSLLLSLCFPNTRKTVLFLIFPIIGAISDYLENNFIKKFLKDINEINDFNVKLSSTFTILKFISIYATFAMIIILLVTLIIKILKNKIVLQNGT